jgi:hypothetical protein
MPLNSKKIKPLYRALQIVPDSLNEEQRTVDVTFGTNEPILMRGWDGSYYEVLSFKKENVRMARLNSGAPFLKDHRPDKQRGVVVSASVDGTKGVATVRFSKSQSGERLFQDVKDGIRKSISVGYRVYAYVEESVPEEMRGENYIPTYTATDWEPYEVSSVSIPADYKAGVRFEEGLEENEFSITNLNKKTMPLTDEEKRELERLRKLELEKNPAPGLTVEQIEANRKLAVAEEKTRSSEILLACRKSNLKPEFAEKLITDGTALSDARALIIEEFSKADSPMRNQVVSVGNGMEENEKLARGLEESLMHRLDKSVKLTELSKPYAGGNLGDMARNFLESKGVKTAGMERREIARQALEYRSGGAMSTTDFPFILGNVFNNMLRKAYGVLPQTFREFTRASIAPDFRDMLRTQMGDLTGFKKVVEGGEYEMASFGDAQEKYKVAKYGMIVPITWEAIVNDVLDAFSRVPASIAMKSKQMQSNIVWGLITGNAAMADTFNVFSTDHANYVDSGSVIDVANLTEGRKYMRKQTDLTGDVLNLTPEFLIVGSNLEGVANQYTSANYVATKNADINPDFNKSLKVIVEPRLDAFDSGNAWYLAANPNIIDTIEYAFLDGEGELFTETRQGFNTDGMEIKARMVFGAGVIDHRGLFKNVGA